jgi:hypothetical protein
LKRDGVAEPFELRDEPLGDSFGAGMAREVVAAEALRGRRP